ncbi:MAG: hypothetical protein ACLQU4_14865 [Limisphaerales bacterium]
MKIRLFIFCVVVVVLVFVAFWFPKRLAQPLVTTSIGTNVLPATTVKPTSLAQSTAPTNTPAVSVITAGAPRPTLGPKEERMLGILSTYNDVPINFYGKLEDQFQNPVVGAEIKASIMVNNGRREGTDHPSTTSDANGFFEFHGKGESIGMMPQKVGYALASVETLFKFSGMEDHPYVSDANSPTVVKMWKLQGSEPLANINQHYRLLNTGVTMNFDLLTGAIVPNGGDIKITVNRPAGIISTRTQQDWSLTVEAVDGGLVETSMAESRVTYIAPENGYQPSAAFTMSTTNNTWYQSIHQMFFLNSRSSQVYSKVYLSFRLNEDPKGFMNITFAGVANTNGSRNWEGDSNTIASIVQ